MFVALSAQLMLLLFTFLCQTRQRLSNLMEKFKGQDLTLGQAGFGAGNQKLNSFPSCSLDLEIPVATGAVFESKSAISFWHIRS